MLYSFFPCASTVDLWLGQVENTLHLPYGQVEMRKSFLPWNFSCGLLKYIVIILFIG